MNKKRSSGIFTRSASNGRIMALDLSSKSLKTSYKKVELENKRLIENLRIDQDKLTLRFEV